MEESTSTATNGLETIAAEKAEVQAGESLELELDQQSEVHERAISAIQQDGPRGVKRPAEDDDDADNDDGDNGDVDVDVATKTPPLSKNQQKKLRRQAKWEEMKEEKRLKRKEKRHERQERKRLEREAEIAAAAAEGREPSLNDHSKHQRAKQTQVPVTVILDCQYEKYMMEKELVSLTSQVTRCYSDNRSSQYPVHMFISSYGGAMKTRFETTLQRQHEKWKGVRFVEGDFTEAAKEAKELMAGPRGGKVVDILERNQEGDSISKSELPGASKKSKRSAPVPEPEASDVDKSIVYLTADSPYVLERLEPNTCYVIGGIIDKNREKGLCYKIAREKNVRTAKLPIGEFMVLQSRHVLATNHVMDIMLKYLELGHWGEAFMKVIPTRKGGALIEDDATSEADQVHHTQNGGIRNGGEAEHEKVNAQKSHEAAEVEGENAEEGVQTNALDREEWSAPPMEAEENEDTR